MTERSQVQRLLTSMCGQKQGDNKKIGKPEYQVYPSSVFNRKNYPDYTVFLQVFEEGLHPVSAPYPDTLQRSPEPTLPGVH